MDKKPWPRSKLHPRCKLLAEVLLEERLLRGWTLEYLASLTGFSRQTHSDIEAGKIAATSDIECRLEDAFGIPMWVFWRRVCRRDAGLVP